jgi:hypothetical protein
MERHHKRTVPIKDKKTLDFSSASFHWCPAAESDYELVLTMDPLYRLTSGAYVAS